jgi:chorismate synthase
MILNKNQIFASDDLPRETVEIEEWGGEVIVRALSCEEEKSIHRLTKDGDVVGAQVHIVAKTVVGEDGAPVFSKADAGMLVKKSGAIIRRLAETAIRLSGLDDDPKNS